MTNEATLPLASEGTEWKLPSSRKVAVLCLVLTETCLFSIFIVGPVNSGPSASSLTTGGVLPLSARR